MVAITIKTSKMVRTTSDNFSHFMAIESIRTVDLSSDDFEIVKYFNTKSQIVGHQIRDICGYSYFLAKFRKYIVRTTPIVGTIAKNVRPLDRRAIVRSKGTIVPIVPILLWANRIGQDWVETTVRSYRKAGD